MGQFRILLFTIQNCKMKLLVVLAILISVSVALPASNECERKTEVLTKALVNLAKKNINVRDECTTCFDDILKAVADCVSFPPPRAPTHPTPPHPFHLTPP